MITKLTALLAVLSLVSVSSAMACDTSCKDKGDKDGSDDTAVVSFEGGDCGGGGGSCGRKKDGDTA